MVNGKCRRETVPPFQKYLLQGEIDGNSEIVYIDLTEVNLQFGYKLLPVFKFLCFQYELL